MEMPIGRILKERPIVGRLFGQEKKEEGENCWENVGCIDYRPNEKQVVINFKELVEPVEMVRCISVVLLDVTADFRGKHPFIGYRFKPPGVEVDYLPDIKTLRVGGKYDI